jgi:hypothetical protein
MIFIGQYLFIRLFMAMFLDEFLKLMPKDCYALSLSYDRNEENILHIDSFYDHLFIYKFLEEISKKLTVD